MEEMDVPMNKAAIVLAIVGSIAMANVVIYMLTDESEIYTESQPSPALLRCEELASEGILGEWMEKLRITSLSMEQCEANWFHCTDMVGEDDPGELVSCLKNFGGG